ncbi:MAG: hypothetical protein M3160_06300 [Candidatus Eremiobacteraeota bacterium]|nr:hypothetical protein [Candidatus Eremiobacteraeota bacterium]
MNYLTFEDPGAVNLVRRALKLAEAGDLYGAAETASVDVSHAAVVSEGLRKGMRYSIGAEVDNDPRARPDAQNIVDAMKPDGIIRSVHFLTIEHPEKGADWQWPFDSPEFATLYDHVGVERTWELYMAALLDAIEKLPTHIVGHFYVPTSFGHWPSQKKLEQYEDQLLNAVSSRGIAIEFNTRFLYRDNPPEQKQKYLDANLRLLKKARKKGVGVAIGADAHSPKDQGASFDKALELLDKAEINELIFPVAGRLARVALRATKEHLEQRAALTDVPVAGSSISGFSRAELASMNGGEFPAQAQIEKPKARRAARAVSPKERVAKIAPARAPKGPVKTERPSPKVAPAASKKVPLRKMQVTKGGAGTVETKKAASKERKPVRSAKAAIRSSAAKKASPPRKPVPRRANRAVKKKTSRSPGTRGRKVASKKTPRKSGAKTYALKKKQSRKPPAPLNRKRTAKKTSAKPAKAARKKSSIKRR